MTEIQALIDKLIWFDLPRKLKEILSLINSKKVYPTYANNAAALAGGLTLDDIYKTPAGILSVVV